MSVFLTTEARVRFLRIDDRLIHGQVIVGWLPTLNSKQILVVNDRIARDSMRQEMMSLSVPPTVELAFRACDELTTLENLDFATLVLVASPADAWQCLDSGLIPEEFNVGGMHARPGKEELFEALHVNAQDREYFHKILDTGIHAVFQPTPQNDPIPMGDIL